jgi:hypothetical protein
MGICNADSLPVNFEMPLENFHYLHGTQPKLVYTDNFGCKESVYQDKAFRDDLTIINIKSSFLDREKVLWKEPFIEKHTEERVEVEGSDDFIQHFKEHPLFGMWSHYVFLNYCDEPFSVLQDRMVNDSPCRFTISGTNMGDVFFIVPKNVNFPGNVDHLQGKSFAYIERRNIGYIGYDYHLGFFYSFDVANAKYVFNNPLFFDYLHNLTKLYGYHHVFSDAVSVYNQFNTSYPLSSGYFANAVINMMKDCQEVAPIRPIPSYHLCVNHYSFNDIFQKPVYFFPQHKIVSDL